MNDTLQTNFKREYITPMQVFKAIGIEMPEWITFNPKLNKRSGAQYEIVRGSTNDGTLLFELQLAAKTVSNLFDRTSYCVHDSLDGVIGITYEVGYISIATVFGHVDLPAGRYPGQRQRMRIPVKTTLIKA